MTWIASLTDTGIRADVTSLTADGTLSYADSLQILSDVAARGKVSVAEFGDLQTIAANVENGITTSDYVASIFYQLVEGSQSNQTYTGGNTSDGGLVKSLGDLAAGTSASQLTELIAKWFLGSDMPDPTIPGADTTGGNPAYPVYAPYNYPLFGSAGVPQVTDIAQGSIGDCVLLAGVIETLLNDPSLINSMFVSDGNGVYGVRFYVDGTPTWVTVNSELPTYHNHLVFNNAYVADPTQGLWVDLLEKAYAQLSATGNIGHPAVNSYANVEDDQATNVLTNLTDSSSASYFYSADINWNAYKTFIIDAVNQHDDVILETGNNVTGTTSSTGLQMLVSNHAYAVVGYDSSSGDFIVRNPWGVEGGTQPYVTQFEVSMSDIASSAVQGNFVVDNSAASNVVFTGPQLTSTLVSVTYGSFQATTPTLGAHTTLPLASLFQVQDMAGLAVTHYMVDVLGAGASISLNGAANLANSTQLAAGEIVFSATDLAKLTLTTGASGRTIELFLSGDDGTGFSTPLEMAFNIDGRSITVLPTANPMAAPSTAISLAGLFTLAGSDASAVTTYTISLDAGAGAFNLNGATNLLGGSTSTIEVSAADLAKITYTAPSTSGTAVIDVSASSSTSASDVTQVEIDVGYSVAVALLDYKSGTIPYQFGVADSAANIFGNLDALEALMPNWNLLGVLVDDVAKQTEAITFSQYTADRGVLSLLSGNYALDVTGVTAAQAADLIGNSAVHVSGVQIADTAAEVMGSIDALESLAAAGQITGITLTGSSNSAARITTAQLAADAAVLSDISGSYSLAVSGSSSSVASQLGTLQALAGKGELASISLSDPSANITITAAQLASDATALNDITSSFTLTVAAGTTAVNIAGLSGQATTVQFAQDASQYSVTAANGVVTVASGGVSDQLTGVTAIKFADFTEIVAAAPGSAGAPTTGNITELYAAVLGREPDAGGLAFYQSYLQKNPATGLIQFATWFLESTEYSSAHTYAETAAGEQQFISDSYQNLLHRAASPSDVSFYETNVLGPAVNNLTPGTAAYAAAQLQAHALMLVYLSASSEFLTDVQVTAQNSAGASHWLILT